MATRTVDQIVADAAKRHGIPLDRLKAMIHVESGGNPRAVSRRGARGIMQVKPSTAAEVGVTGDLHDPENGVEAGARYLRKQYDRFGDWDTATEAYNAGPARVAHRRARGERLPAETRAYTRKIKAREAASVLAQNARTE